MVFIIVYPPFLDEFPSKPMDLIGFAGFVWKLGEYIQIQWINMKTSSTHSFSQWNPMAGWWLTYPSQKIWRIVSWDDDIPNWMDSHKTPWFQTTNQMAIYGDPCSTPFLVLETGRPVPVLDILDARAQDGDLRMIQPSFSWKIGKTNGNKTG